MKRLAFQGVHVQALESEGLLLETVRRHFRSEQQSVHYKLNTGIHGLPRRWSDHFPNGAGDLEDQEPFVISDPDLQALEGLFALEDPRSPGLEDTTDEEQ